MMNDSGKPYQKGEVAGDGNLDSLCSHARNGIMKK